MPDERRRGKRAGEEIAGAIGVLAIVIAFALLVLSLWRSGWIPWRR